MWPPELFSAARKLMAMDWNGFSDPYAAISFNGLTAQSTIKKANLNPDWHENFAFWMKPNPNSTILSVMVGNLLSFNVGRSHAHCDCRLFRVGRYFSSDFQVTDS